jgi:hypothetical protein
VAYDAELADRLRAVLAGEPALAEVRMFGALCFTVAGHLAVGVTGEELLVRMGPDGRADALSEPGVREFDMTGRPMRNWVVVGPQRIAADDELAAWADRGVAFARSLPAKA